MPLPDRQVIEVFPTPEGFDGQGPIKTYGIRIIGDREVLLDLVVCKGGRMYSTATDDGIEYIVMAHACLGISTGRLLKCGSARCSILSVREFCIPYP